MSTATQSKTQTEQGLGELVHHDACPACYPDPYPGMLASCGYELLGIPSFLDSTWCQRCEKTWNCTSCGYPLKEWREYWRD